MPSGHRKKRASFFGWLTVKGNLSQKRKKGGSESEAGLSGRLPHSDRPPAAKPTCHRPVGHSDYDNAWGGSCGASSSEGHVEKNEIAAASPVIATVSVFMSLGVIRQPAGKGQPEPRKNSDVFKNQELILQTLRETTSSSKPTDSRLPVRPQQPAVLL